MVSRRQRTVEARERQAEIIKLRTQGLKLKEIAAHFHFSIARAGQLYEDGIRRIGEPEISVERKRAIEARDINLQELYKKREKPPAAKVIQYPDGRIETIYDNDFWLRIIGEIRKWEEHSARLLGLYSTELKMSDTQQPRTYDDIVTALQTLMESAPAAIEPPVETQATDVTDETSRIEDIEQALLNGEPRTE